MKNTNRLQWTAFFVFNTHLQHKDFASLQHVTLHLWPCNMGTAAATIPVWTWVCKILPHTYQVFFYIVPLSQMPSAKEALLHHCYPVIINSSCCNIMLCFLRPVLSTLELSGVRNCRTPLQFLKKMNLCIFFYFIMELYNRYTFGFCVRFHENRHKFACLISAEHFISSN